MQYVVIGIPVSIYISLENELVGLIWLVSMIQGCRK